MKVAVTYENGEVFQHFDIRKLLSFMKLKAAK